MTAAPRTVTYHLCAGTRRDGLPCSRLVSLEGYYCPTHAHQSVTLACDCDGCHDFARVMSGPSRLGGKR